ncbi:molybdate ABC transporter substrate-binding protein [Hoyosella rhizosphaerae]|uniref:Molybdate-binding protein n=1 Tax=Hoyosella rhizosphaerae TaxID=1755582 RepID=A0A916UHC9_9ACTN|nr:molybdate ABC transporter substrate-binding protein [Hoyosella rhizosphaerae]MBN4928275.1 molybdate ABC transporter substrate-binding protein [Hoyosella rhizosphaerae]GGC73735.1 molybdate-binding protein [Hoyosella rhizosphaerae]
MAQPRRRGALRVVCIGAVAAAIATGCAPADQQDQLTVFAASSLRTAFDDIAKDFESAYPQTAVNLNFTGSSDLLDRIKDGAPADVFATETEEVMWLALDAELIDDPQAFARNELVIIVPNVDDVDVSDIDDVIDSGTPVASCASETSCGTIAQRLARRAGFAIDQDVQERSATEVLNRVLDGSAVAGLVYRTDALSAGEQVRIIELPFSATTVNMIGIVESSQSQPLARAFTDFVTSPQGQRALERAGFSTATQDS